MDLSSEHLRTDELLEMAFDAVTAGRSDLPAGLEERLLSRNGDGERVGWHDAWTADHGRRAEALNAFIRTAAELAELFDSLAADDWARTTPVEGATVREIVEHLVGVERYILGCLDRRPRLEAPRREDHWPVTRMAARDLTGEPNQTVSQTWWAEVLALIAASGELGPDQPVNYHHLAGTLQGLLVVRTFELWTHGNDIRQAIGRRADNLDEPRLSLMVNELMRVLPFGLALSGCPRPGRTARFSLSGPGGGTFDVALDPTTPIGPPDITLTTTVIDLCLLASNRLTPEALAVVVDGDHGLLAPVLVGAAAFAAD